MSLYIIVLIIAIALFNIISNIVSLKYYTNAMYFEELHTKHWLLRIPFLIWYWLEALVRFKQIENLLFLLTTCIIGVSIIGLLYLIAEYNVIFILTLATILTLASMFLAFFVFEFAHILLTKLKKKKKQNK